MSFALRREQVWPWVVLVAAGIGFWMFAPSGRSLHMGVLVCIYAIGAYGMAFLWACTGTFSIAHGALAGVGAYTAALLSLRLGAPFPVAILAAMGLAAAIAFLIGLPSLRVKGHYFLLVTFAFAEIAQLTMINWRSLTNGDAGLVVAARSVSLFGLEIADRSAWFVLVFVLMLIAAALTIRLRGTPFGRRLAAVRENEPLAMSVGINAPREKLLAFMLSGALAGLAGALIAYYQRTVTPIEFGSHAGIQYVFMVLVGGTSGPIGPVIGALVSLCLPELLGFSPTANEILLGVLFIVIILVMPEGVGSALQAALSRRREPRGEPGAAAPGATRREA